MHSLVPSVCKVLSKQETIHTERFTHYLKLMSSEKFPISNMCYQLFNDVIHWYSCVSSTEMRYGDDTNKFWYIGKRLFHGKFIQFVWGSAGKGCVARGETEPGEYDPHKSSINFAVPHSLSKLPNSKIPERVMIGIMTQMIDNYINTDHLATSITHTLTTIRTQPVTRIFLNTDVYVHIF